MNPNDRSLTAFTMLGHAMFHTYELVIPVFVVVWLDVFSVSAALLGLLVGIGYACIGVGALPSGMLADRYGSRTLILGGLVGMGAGFLVISVAPTTGVLAVGLLLWGTAASVYHPAGLALISRGTTQRGTAFAYHGVAGNVGVATGPLLGTVLLSVVGWRLTAAVLVVVLVFALAIAVRLEFDEAGGVDVRAFGRSTKRLFTGGFALVFLIGILYGLYYRGALTFLPDVFGTLRLFEPVTLAGRSVEPSQYVYSGLLLLGGVGQYAGGMVVDRVDAEHALVGTLAILCVIALVFVPMANAGVLSLLAISGLLGFFIFMEAPINQEVISKHVPVDVRGLSFGYTYTAVYGVGAIGAAAAGLILSRAGPRLLFLVLAVFAASGLLLGWCLFTTVPPHTVSR